MHIAHICSGYRTDDAAITPWKPEMGMIHWEYPTFGLASQPTSQPAKLAQELSRSLCIPLHPTEILNKVDDRDKIAPCDPRIEKSLDSDPRCIISLNLAIPRNICDLLLLPWHRICTRRDVCSKRSLTSGNSKQNYTNYMNFLQCQWQNGKTERCLDCQRGLVSLPFVMKRWQIQTSVSTNFWMPNLTLKRCHALWTS